MATNDELAARLKKAKADLQMCRETLTVIAMQSEEPIESFRHLNRSDMIVKAFRTLKAIKTREEAI